MFISLRTRKFKNKVYCLLLLLKLEKYSYGSFYQKMSVIFVIPHHLSNWAQLYKAGQRNCTHGCNLFIEIAGRRLCIIEAERLAGLILEAIDQVSRQDAADLALSGLPQSKEVQSLFLKIP